MNETAQGLIGIEAGLARGCGDVIDCNLPSRAQRYVLGGDVIFPLPDTGDRVVLFHPRPGPGLVSALQARRSGAAAAAAVPGTVKHAVDDLPVELVPECW